MKNVAFKVNPSEYKRLTYYMGTPEGGQTIISKFVRDAIREKCERTRHIRAGGMVMTFPNPDVTALSPEQKAEIVQILKEADLKLSRLAPGAFDLAELAAFAGYHFFKMPESQRRSFQTNFENDLGADAEAEALEATESNEIQSAGEEV